MIPKLLLAAIAYITLTGATAELSIGYECEYAWYTRTEGGNLYIDCITIKTETYLSRLYTHFLGREIDPSGKAHWAMWLQSEERTKGAVAYNIVMSSEFMARQLSDEEYIIILYRGLLAREPDAGGLAAWTGILVNGTDRITVFLGFIWSAEFLAQG